MTEECVSKYLGYTFISYAYTTKSPPNILSSAIYKGTAASWWLLHPFKNNIVILNSERLHPHEAKEILKEYGI